MFVVRQVVGTASVLEGAECDLELLGGASTGEGKRESREVRGELHVDVRYG